MNEIVIKTKFKVGDIAYAYYNGAFYKFTIECVKVYYNSDRKYQDISYHAKAIMAPECECTFCHDFQENELHTKETLLATLKAVEEMN